MTIEYETDTKFYSQNPYVQSNTQPQFNPEHYEQGI